MSGDETKLGAFAFEEETIVIQGLVAGSKEGCGQVNL